ncbi:MAG TPA: hypothetical protein PKV72_06970 [Candidatus Peribacteria bacterium]|nr:hypothetical protein [Candidatus Peribacteria bacterium]
MHNTMMYTTGPVFVAFPILHFLGALAVFIGIVLLLMWAYKHLTAAQLKKWGLILVIGGAVVCMFTLVASMHGGNKYGMRRTGGMMIREDRGIPYDSMMKLDADDEAVVESSASSAK